VPRNVHPQLNSTLNGHFHINVAKRDQSYNHVRTDQMLADTGLKMSLPPMNPVLLPLEGITIPLPRQQFFGGTELWGDAGSTGAIRSRTAPVLAFSVLYWLLQC
jgi:hypothetical protein